MPSNKEMLLPCVEIEPKQPAAYTTIWLHGLGADGNDFTPIVSDLNPSATKNMRFIFPHAPIMPVTINNGYEMRAWFDIHDITPEAKIDKTGIDQSTSLIQQLIKQEIERGIPSNHIFLAGFSQGAVIALTTGLRCPDKLAGIIALSGYLPLANQLFQQASDSNRNTPIFLAHGFNDAIVPYALGQLSLTELTKAGYTVSWHSYMMPHSVCMEEIKDISDWMQERVNPQG